MNFIHKNETKKFLGSHDDLSHLKRGYENFEEKLFKIGAHIR